MAKIKCKYEFYKCEHGGICKHHNFLGNGFEYDECCERANDKPFMVSETTMEIPLQCRHLEKKPIMFERNGIDYTYSDSGLEIENKLILKPRILFLEIDDKVLIDRESEK